MIGVLLIAHSWIRIVHFFFELNPEFVLKYFILLFFMLDHGFLQIYLFFEFMVNIFQLNVLF